MTAAGGEALAPSEELTRRLREEFTLDQVEAEFIVLVGRSGGLFLASQVGLWLRVHRLAASDRTVSRWIHGLRKKLDLSPLVVPGEGSRRWVYQFVGTRLYGELGMENSRWRHPAEKNATLVEIKRRLVSVGAVLSRWWYPWLGTAQASVAWCEALGIDRAVLPQSRRGAKGKDSPNYFPDRFPHAADGKASLFVYPLVVEERDETAGLQKWRRSYTPLWEARGRAGIETTAVVARSAQTLSVPVADVLSGWEMPADSRRAVRDIWFDTKLDDVLGGNAPTVIEAHGGPEGAARRRRELAASIEEARAEVAPGVWKTEELVLEEVPA